MIFHACQRTDRLHLREVSSVKVSLQQQFVMQHFFCIPNRCGSDCNLGEYTQVYVVTNDAGTPRSTNFINISHRKLEFQFFFNVIHVNWQEQSLFSMTKQTSPTQYFPSKYEMTPFQVVFPTRSLQMGVRTDFAQKEPQHLQWQDLGHMCCGRRIQISCHSDLRSFDNCLLLLSVSRYCVGCLSQKCISTNALILPHFNFGKRIWRRMYVLVQDSRTPCCGSRK